MTENITIPYKEWDKYIKENEALRNKCKHLQKTIDTLKQKKNDNIHKRIKPKNKQKDTF